MASLRHRCPTGNWSLLVVLPLAVTAILYTLGVTRLWRRAGHRPRDFQVVGAVLRGRLARRCSRRWCLLSPGSRDVLFSDPHDPAHAADAGRGAAADVRSAAAGVDLGARDRARQRVAQAFRRAAWLRIWRALTRRCAVFLLQAVVLWVWHIPSWYEAALRSDGVHAAQHLCACPRRLVVLVGDGARPVRPDRLWRRRLLRIPHRRSTAAPWARCSRCRPSSGMRSTAGRRRPGTWTASRISSSPAS